MRRKSYNSVTKPPLCNIRGLLSEDSFFVVAAAILAASDAASSRELGQEPGAGCAVTGRLEACLYIFRRALRNPKWKNPRGELFRKSGNGISPAVGEIIRLFRTAPSGSK